MYLIAAHKPWHRYTFVAFAATLKELIVEGVDEELV